MGWIPQTTKRAQTALDEDALGARIEAALLARLRSGEAVLPAMPRVATECLALLRRPDCALAEVADVLARDPLLCAQVLRLAQCASFGGGGTGLSLHQAVARLGMSRLRTVVVQVAARRLFVSHDPTIARACAKLWEHSLAVALLSRQLVRQLGGDLDAELAYLGGLLHDVGKPVVAAILLEAEQKLSGEHGLRRWLDGGAWIRVVQRVHTSVGAELSAAWRLPERVGAIIRRGDDYAFGERRSERNVVHLANAATVVWGLYLGAQSRPEAEETLRSGCILLELEREELDELSDDLREEVAAQLD